MNTQRVKRKPALFKCSPFVFFFYSFPFVAREEFVNVSRYMIHIFPLIKLNFVLMSYKLSIQVLNVQGLYSKTDYKKNGHFIYVKKVNNLFKSFLFRRRKGIFLSLKSSIKLEFRFSSSDWIVGMDSHKDTHFELSVR